MLIANFADLSPQLTFLLTAGEVVVVAYGLLRFIFEPRLERFLDARLKAVREDWEETLEQMEARMDGQDKESARTSLLLSGLTSNVERITVMVERVAQELQEQGKSMAYIEGELRGASLRAKHRGTDNADH